MTLKDWIELIKECIAALNGVGGDAFWMYVQYIRAAGVAYTLVGVATLAASVGVAPFFFKKAYAVRQDGNHGEGPEVVMVFSAVGGIGGFAGALTLLWHGVVYTVAPEGVTVFHLLKTIF